MFGSFILAGVYAAHEHTRLFRSLQVSGTNGLSGSSEASAKPRLSDNGIGQVLFSSASGDSCRRMLFDNRTGSYYEAASISCGRPPEPASQPEPPDRINALRKSFQR